MKNLILFTNFNKAPDNLEYSKWCIESWQHWALRHDITIYLLETPFMDVTRMKPTWQRWNVFNNLDSNDITDFDNIALIDIDTLIHPQAPNFFNEFSKTGSNIGVVKDDIMVEWIVNSIEGYSFLFSGVSIDWTQYFNCGFVVLKNTSHARELTNSIITFYQTHIDTLLQLQHSTLRKGSDQTPVNYLVKEREDILRPYFFNQKWNFTHMHIRGICGPTPDRTGLFLNPIFDRVAYIYHFNGFEKSLRNSLMEECWKRLKS